MGTRELKLRPLALAKILYERTDIQVTRFSQDLYGERIWDNQKKDNRKKTMKTVKVVAAVIKSGK